MQIQLISSVKNGPAKVAIFEKNGTSPIKHVMVPGERVELVIDGTRIDGNNKVEGMQLRVRQVSNNLVIENEFGEGLIELISFYIVEDTVLAGSAWNLGGMEHLAQSSAGIVSYASGLIDLGSAGSGTSDSTAFAGMFVMIAGLASTDTARVNSSNSRRGTVPPMGVTQALVKIAAYAGDNTRGAPTLETYSAAGIKGVAVSTLRAVNAAIDASSSSGADTAAEVQALVNTVLSAQNSDVRLSASSEQATAIAKIAAYADDNTQAPPTLADYTAAVVTGVTAAGLAQLNAAIDATTGTEANTAEKIQSFVINSQTLQPHVISRTSVYVPQGVDNELPAGVTDNIVLGVASGTYSGGAVFDTADMNDTVSINKSPSIAKIGLGEGNDVLINRLAIASGFLNAASSYDGGPGVDTYSQAAIYDNSSADSMAATAYDYSLLDMSGGILSGFEIFSLSEPGTQVATVSLKDVLDMTSGNSIVDTLRFTGNSDDVLTLRSSGAALTTPMVGSLIRDVDGTAINVTANNAGNLLTNDVVIGGVLYDVYQVEQEKHQLVILVAAAIQTHVI